MNEMTHRERVKKALNHEQPDRIPIDLGGSHCSTIHVDAYDRLLSHLNIAPRSPATIRRVSQTVNEIDEGLMRRFGFDCVGIGPGAPDQSIEKDFPDGTWQDEFGVHRRKPKGSNSWDMVKSPLEGDAGINDLENLAWPNPQDPGYVRGLRKKARYLYENTDYAITGYLIYNIIHQAQYLRGFQNWFMDFIENPEFCRRIHEKVADLAIEVAGRFLDEVGEYIEVVMLGDDIAGQNGLMIHPNHFRKFIKPQWKRLFDFMRTRTYAKMCLHCCGNITAILDDIVELGIEVINPVQVSNPQMNTKALKQKYGDKLVFWGAIDTQHVMPMGLVKDVRKEVKNRIEDLAPGGGYILAAVHTIQPDVPPENIVELYDTALEFGRYGT